MQKPRSVERGLSRPGRTRTCNPRFWRPVLCQLSYEPKELRTSNVQLRTSNPGCHHDIPQFKVRRSVFEVQRSQGWLRGLEPPTSGATVRRSNLLSYSHHGAADIRVTSTDHHGYPGLLNLVAPARRVNAKWTPGGPRAATGAAGHRKRDKGATVWYPASHRETES